MPVKVVINLQDAMPVSGCNIAYQAYPEEEVTDEEASTANIVLAFCSMMSDPSFLEMVLPSLERELVVMKREQDAALQGSKKVM